MPPKSKSQAGEWNQCLRCSVIVSSRDLSKHKAECLADDGITHGHIKKDVLFGFVIELRDGGKFTVPKSHEDKLVYLHPSVMQLCGFSIGGLCVFNHMHVLTCWPCMDIEPSAVALSSNFISMQQLESSSLVPVQPFIESGLCAKKIQITPCDGNLYNVNDNMVDFLKRSAENQYVCEGSRMSMCYFGKQYSFTVSEITGQLLQAVDYKLINLSNDDSVCQSLSNLDISDISSNSKDLNSSCDKNLSADEHTVNQSIEHAISDSQTGSPTTPVRETRHKRDLPSNSGTPRTPQTDLSSSSLDCFCTPLIERTARNDSCSNFYKITSDSEFILVNLESDINVKKESNQHEVHYTDIGGLSKEISSLKEIIHLPVEQPQLFKSYGLSPPHGILLYGPSGCGKSMLIQAVTSELNIHIVSVSGADIWSKFYGETEMKIRKIFEDAEQNAPSLIVIDKVEILCPRRDVSHSEMEKRVVASLLTLMDGINNTDSDKFVLVLATSSKPDLIDPALRRPGRFDREIEIGVPSALDRKHILLCMLSKLTHELSDTEIQEIADCTHGYVGADLLALCKEASLCSMKRNINNKNSLCLSYNDFKYSMEVVQPSAMREVQLEVPKVLWTDIGGQEHIKLKLKQAVEWPLKHPAAFTRMGISQPRGVLMYGPPGCSKTMIAKALATESGLNFLAVKGPELFSKWVGESERAVREVFRKARSASPSIIFFDEIDALAVERGSSSGSSNVADRVLAQLLTEIDGVEGLNNVTIVAATNRPDMIDKALLRPGRFDRVLYVPLPDTATRAQIFGIHLAKVPTETDITADWLASLTHNYSGAEISAVCHEAAMCALQEDISSEIVKKSHFELALKIVTPRINEDLITFYQNYAAKSGLNSV